MLVSGFPEGGMELLYWRDRGTEANVIFEKMYGDMPHSKLASSVYNTATIYQSKGQFKTALEFYKKALDLDPGHVNAKTNLAIIMKDQE